MDNNKKLFEGLLKADGIDPANITESERMVLMQMLDREEKHMKHLSRITVGAVWIFALAMIGLLLSEKILEALRIPFVVGCLVIMAAMLTVIIRYLPRHNIKLRECGRKINKLYYLVHGKHRGIALVVKKDGKRFIYWSRIIMVAAALWLFVSLGGAGVYYLLCQRWIFLSSPMIHIFYCTVISLSLVIFVLRDGLKTPLEELVVVKAKSKQSNLSIARPDIWRIIMKHKLTKLAAAAVILVSIIIGINQLGISIDGATVALADVAKRLEQIKNCVFRKTVTVTTEEGKIYKNESHIYYAKAGVRQDNYDGPDAGLQVYLQNSQRRVVWMAHDKKLYNEVALTDEDIDNQISGDPKDIVKEILSKGEYRKLGKKSVDGVLAEGFAFSDKRTLLSMEKEKLDDVAVRIWADVNTNLPIRIEMDCIYNSLETEIVMCDPQWDVELEPDFFEPNIPVDYMRPEQRGLIGIGLEDWPTLKVGSGTAAEKAGVKDGDVVLKVDGNSISHAKSPGDALNLLLGKAGEKVSLTVKRGEQILTFEIERAPIPE